MRRHPLPLALLLVLGLAGPARAAADAAPPPFHMPVPEGWSAESLAFPLEFAPELPFSGVEELRYAPGMFKLGAENYWTCAFAWWVEAEASRQPRAVGALLEVYFEGLARAVCEAQGRTMEGGEFIAKLTPVSPSTGVNMVGNMVTYDPFGTHRNIVLFIEVRFVSCPDSERQIMYFGVSPRAYNDPVWIDLKALRGDVACAP